MAQALKEKKKWFLVRDTYFLCISWYSQRILCCKISLCFVRRLILLALWYLILVCSSTQAPKIVGFPGSRWIWSTLRSDWFFSVLSWLIQCNKLLKETENVSFWNAVLIWNAAIPFSNCSSLHGKSLSWCCMPSPWQNGHV